MDLKQLQAMGAIVPRTLFKKDIPIKRPVLKPVAEWADPDQPEQTGEVVSDTVTAWVRKRSSADFMEMINAPDRDKMHIAVLRCICHEDGTEVFESLEQAKQLQEWMFVPLMTAVNEVNQYGLKNSQPRTNSGASLRSASAAGRSRNGKRQSASRSTTSGTPTPPNAAP